MYSIGNLITGKIITDFQYDYYDKEMQFVQVIQVVRIINVYILRDGIICLTLYVLNEYYWEFWELEIWKMSRELVNFIYSDLRESMIWF